MTTTHVHVDAWDRRTDRNGEPIYVREGFVLWFYRDQSLDRPVRLQRSTWGNASTYPDFAAASARVDQWLHDDGIIAARLRPYRLQFSETPDVLDEPTTPVATPAPAATVTVDSWLADLDEAVELARRAQDRVDELVQRARSAGASWADVGDSLGISRQGARQKYAQTASQTSPQKETLL